MRPSIIIDHCRFHRNGCHCESFNVVHFRERDGRKFAPRVAILFDGKDRCAVVNPLNPVARFRGDYYEPTLRKAIEAADADGTLYKFD